MIGRDAGQEPLRTAQPMPQLGEKGPSRRSLRLMIIVDYPGLRDAMRMLLDVEGYRVTAVATLEEARHTPCDGIDLLVTDDYLRNGQTGVQVIAALREDLGVPVKAVLVTWQCPAAAPAGVDPDLHIVSKPLYPQQLLSLVRELTAADPTRPLDSP